MKVKSVLAASAVLWGMGLLAEEIALEAEAFRETGGWVVDSQSMDQVGSPFLLAHGLGEPVKNAKTTFRVTKAGTWRVSVRTRNWTAPWSDSPAGLFDVLVDGKRLAVPFGDGSGDWHWKTAAVDLAAGEHELELADRTGFDGRCDLVVLRDDDREPDLRAIREAAARQRKTEVVTCDLAVAGGGVAGICAAVTAARKGLKVVLIQDRPVLGGNNSSEIRVHLGGMVNTGKYPHLGDVLNEISPAHFGNARDFANYEDARKLRVVEAETNLTLVLNCRVTSAKTKDGRIESCTGVSVRDGSRREFRARWFVDATGDGALGALAGADFRMGREGRDEFGEPNAPEKGDSLMMGASVQWYAAKGDRPFPVREWMQTFTDENGYALRRGDWDWETGLTRNTVTEIERVRDYGMLIAYSNWAFVKNVSTNRAAFADRRLAWVAYNAGKRESRRLIGDYFVTERDVMERVEQPDGTCESTWSIDLHYPKTKDELKFEGESFRATSIQTPIHPYAIPYRALYSRNVANLFMAGRDISVSHIALGTVRVMRTTGMMGEVVGLAAGICARRSCDPRGVYEKHLDELKAEMTAGAGRADFVPPNQGYNLADSLDKPLKKAKDRRSMKLESPESQGVDSRAILKWIDRVEREIDSLHSFVLVRHGKVIAEGDWAPYETLDVPHVLFSHSKSYTSTAIGFLYDEKKIDLNERVCDILKDKLPENPSANLLELRVRDLLTMCMGNCEAHAVWGHPEIRDWARAFLAKPMPEKPGLRMRYDSDATYLLAEIVERKSGEKMMDYLNRKLFSPLGMDSVRTTFSPTGVPCGGWGMKASARDNAKFGQLYLNEGTWFGKRILSKEWVRLAGACQSDSSVMNWGPETAGYGFQFWRCSIDAYRADGMRGQLTIISPKHDFVLSILAGTWSPILHTVWEELVPAMGEGERDHDDEALAALRARCDSLELKRPEGSRSDASEAKLIGDWQVDGKAWGIRTVSLAKTATGWSVGYDDVLGRHEIPAGYGAWEKGRLRLSKEDEVDFIALTPGEHAVASAGAWKDGTLSVRTFFTTGPFRFEFSFRPATDGTVELKMHRIVPTDETKTVTLRRVR